MLHFIYNSDVIKINKQIVAVLVNHSLKEGLFVLQIPVHPPFDEQKPTQDYINIIQNCFDKRITITDIIIKNVGKWKCSGLVAEKFH